MERPILIRQARIIDPTQKMDLVSDLFIYEGVIKEIGDGIHVPEGTIVLEASGLWAVPGLVDMHVHLREPGEEYKETIETGTSAAVAGGFTTVACMPNTLPVNDSSSVTRFILDRAKEAQRARVLPIAAITKGQKGENLTEFSDLLSAGAIAFSDDGRPVVDASMMRRALEYSLNFDALIISHSEELSLSRDGLINEGKISTLMGLKGIPKQAEEIAIYRDTALAELTGARLHIAHVSTMGSVEIIRQAKARGVKVTCETAPHYFSLTEDAVWGYNTNAKMNPPLRTEQDRMAIIQGLKDGTIDAIASDHAPHSVLEKECEFQLAANGIIGLETSLPLTLELYRQGYLDPLRLVELMSTSPCRILNIPFGTLKPGSKADVTLIDPDRTFDVKPETLQSLSKNTPFLGKSLKGRAVFTIVAGRFVHDLENKMGLKSSL